MNKNLIFIILACAIFILSYISTLVAPLINKIDGNLENIKNWGTINCKLLKDEYDYNKNHKDELSKTDEDLDEDKEEIEWCKKRNIMYYLEYISFIFDFTLGFICTLLGIIRYLEIGKYIEKFYGLIGLISGVIVTILTIIYVGYSGDIFCNDVPYIYDALDGTNPIEKLYSNKAYLHWDGEKYVYNYDEDDAMKNFKVGVIRYKDLRKKEYNYDSELYRASKDKTSEFYSCKYDPDNFPSTRPKYPSSETDPNKQKNCEYIWYTNTQNKSVSYNELYDRWLTTIILGVFVSLCGIGLALIGILLFLNKDDSSFGQAPVK